MYFEAEANGRKYEVNVSESKTHWRVELKEKDMDWVRYDIPKRDYIYVDDTLSFIFNNSSYLVDVVGSGSEYTVFTRGAHAAVKVYNEESILHESLKAGSAFGGSGDLKSGMPGKIVKVFVKAGDRIHVGDPLLVMEAMKMENEMRATSECKVRDVLVKPGDNVESGVVLITFDKVE